MPRADRGCGPLCSEEPRPRRAELESARPCARQHRQKTAGHRGVARWRAALGEFRLRDAVWRCACGGAEHSSKKSRKLRGKVFPWWGFLGVGQGACCWSGVGGFMCDTTITISHQPEASSTSPRARSSRASRTGLEWDCPDSTLPASAACLRQLAMMTGAWTRTTWHDYDKGMLWA